jgi:hypothetical protein
MYNKMSIYQSGSITRVLDPIIDITNNRVEFVLPSNTVLSSDMRLLNLGVTTSVADKGYNRFAGVGATIRNLYLLSNGVTVDQLLDANTWLAFKETNKDYKNVVSMGRMKAGHDLGLVYNSRTGATDGNQLSYPINAKLTKTTAAATDKGTLSLNDVLPFLKASSMVPTTIYKDLRLVIEYETDIKKLVTTDNVTATILSTPFLSVEEMLDPAFIAQATSAYKGLGFMCIERDILNAPTVLATDVGTDNTGDNNIANSFSLQTRAYDDKYVSRLLIVPKALADEAYEGHTANIVAGGGGLGAVSLLKPKLNIVVNGTNKLSGNGAEGYSQIQGLLTDTWGDMCVSWQANTVGLFKQESVYAAHQDFVSYQGYMGINVNEFVQSLRLNLDYQAQLPPSAAQGEKHLASLNSAYSIMTFAECRKSIMVQPDGSFIISYM